MAVFTNFKSHKKDHFFFDLAYFKHKTGWKWQFMTSTTRTASIQYDWKTLEKQTDKKLSRGPRGYHLHLTYYIMSLMWGHRVQVQNTHFIVSYWDMCCFFRTLLPLMAPIRAQDKFYPRGPRRNFSFLGKLTIYGCKWSLSVIFRNKQR